ncbi:ABC transporter ATP-binding protein [Alkalihalobacterium chitinilyticum]|uniref:ABC transporter ATP-binding protein n=1 Tax=Alkalihalobacterium chitinilyticum TaxID=2980103 RepID=A0ABT5VA46_9BACI|nr:ABC transporter ATP-binding protein [Alkalihalobacterium chitinilyticum]MDE5412155.1 ABC transporter ATP-binding protein [Alkalihalobacterium chitinilyticum]
MKLSVQNVVTKIDQKPIIQNINFHVNDGEFVGVIGPNGSGKSTLLKTIYRIYAPSNGTILINQSNTNKWKNRRFAQQVAVVGQESSVPFDFTVEDIVSMGRHPHKGFLEKDNDYDETIVTRSLNEVGIEHYRNRSFSDLSGGEKQRVLIARALTQEPKLFILDEPTNHLDIHHQLHLLDVVKGLKLTSLAALHDLNLAAAYCDKLLVINKGEIVAEGSPEQVLTEGLLADVFHVNGTIIKNPITEKVHVLYTSKAEAKSIV